MSSLTLNHLSADTHQTSSCLPALRRDLRVYPGPEQADGSPSWTLTDPLSNQSFRLGWLEYQQLKFWTPLPEEQFKLHLNKHSGLTIGLEQIRQLRDFLVNNHLVTASQQEQTAALQTTFSGRQRKHGPGLLSHYFFIRIPLIRPDRFLQKTLPAVNVFCQRQLWLLLLVLGLVGSFLTLRQWDQFQTTVSNYFSLSHFHWYLGVIIFAKILHEFGHAYTATRYGCRVNHMGVALMLLWPVLYTDTSDAWKLTSRKQRLHIGAAGVIVELCLAIIATLLWSLLPEGPARAAMVLLASAAWISSLLINLNPFMRFDGYYLLSDWLNVPNLQSRAFALSRWKLREILFQYQDSPPERFDPRLQTTLICYGFATWIYRLVLYFGIALLVYHTLFKVAGIMLMVLELIVLIALPCLTELKIWWQKKTQMKLTVKNSIALLLLCGLLAFIIVPWQGSIAAPAILTTQSKTTMYPAVAARIAELRVSLDQQVAAGDILAVLESPDLTQRIRILQQRITILQWQINHPDMSGQRFSDRNTRGEELVALLTELKGHLQQQSQLTIKAPFAGKIVAIDAHSHAGAWVTPAQALMTLVDPLSVKVEAYFSEAELQRIQPAQSADFYPQTPEPDVKPITVAFKSADAGSSATLNAAYLASYHGGDIATVSAPNGALTPLTAHFRWVFTPLKNHLANPYEVAGKLQVPAARTSFLSQFSGLAKSVFMRESGF